MKTKFYLLIVLLFCLSNLGYSQTGIGTYSVHDGGFENHTANLAGGSTTNAALSTSLWTASTTANVVRLYNATGGRSGSKCVSLGSNNGTIKSFYTPQLAGAFAPNTIYQVQFWYKSASTTALDASTVDIYVDNTSATQTPPIGTKQSVNAGLSTNVGWTKVAVSITTNATAAGNFGVAGLSIDAATAGYLAEFDDFVVYQSNTADSTKPLSPGTVTATGASGSTANISWGAASGGIDGGGYLVVRYATTVPSANDDPNQNGIYKFAGTIGAGVVRYIGSNASFTDTSLSPGVDYYYKVYTVDKAFNYSDESTTSAAVQALATTYYYDGTGPLTDITNWGTNTNGTGTNPANFTDVAQVFEIRNTTAVALDGSWTVGTDPANGTKVRLGNTDQAAITLTLNSGASILPAGTGNFDVMTPSSGKQTVIYQGTTAISFGNIFDANFEVVYDAVTISSTTTKSFGTVSIINGANVTFTATPIIKNISVDQNSTLVAPTGASSYITIPSGGAVAINGTVKVPKLTGFVSSNVGTAGSTGGDFQFIGAENLTLGANSIVEYARDATGAQTVTARVDYKNVTLSGTSPKSIAGTTAISGTFTINQTGSSLVTLNGDTTVNSTLLFTNGKINTGINTLILGSSANISGASASSGWVIGNLRKTTSSGASPSFTYTIGDANYYTPVALTFSNNTSATGTLTAKTASGDHPQIATSGIIASNSINRTWTLTNSNLAGLSTYNASFTYATQDNDSNVLPQFFASRLYNGVSWTNLTTSGTPTSISLSASSISGFGDFAIGQVCINPTSGGTIAGTQSLCSPANPAAFSSSAPASGYSGTLEYQWQSSTNNLNFSDIEGAITSTYNAPVGLTTTTYYRRLARVSCESDWTGAAESNVITVTVDPTISPTFTQVNPICLGGTLSALPTTSNNGISGAWSPALNTASTTTYTFTPSAGQCATTASMTITVNNSVAGTVSADQTIISGTQPANITLANSSGAIQWQRSTDNINFTAIAGATSSILTGGQIGTLTANRFFRAFVKSGNCASVFSDVLIVNVVSGTSIIDAQCGATLARLGTDIMAANLPSATDYRFKVIANGTTEVIDRGNRRYFNLTALTTGAAYNTSYTISVSVKINGVWGIYGTACVVTTPALPKSKVRAVQCDATLATLSTDIQADWLQFATDYRFKVVANGTTEIIERGSLRYFNLTALETGANYNTAYTISVAAKHNGVWGDYGITCTVSTPIAPTTKVQVAQCGATLPALNTGILADNLQFATAYRFKVVVNGASYEINPQGNRRYFNLASLPIPVAAGTTYIVSVAAQFNGVWGEEINYGTECNVTTPGTAANSKQATSPSIATTDFSLVAYPNPSSTDFKIQLQGANDDAVSILVFDITGRQIENKVVQSNDIESISLGQNYSTGVYSVIVSQGMNTKTVRLLKN